MEVSCIMCVLKVASILNKEMALKRAVFLCFLLLLRIVIINLGALSADATSQLDVFGHNGDTFGVNGAQVGVFKEADQVGFAGFLQSHHGAALEAEISLEILGDFSNQALEGQLADEQLSALLVTSDFTQGDCAGPVSVRLLHTTGGWRTLASCLGGQLLPRSLSSGRFASSLLCTGHACVVTDESQLMLKPTRTPLN